MVLVPGGIVLPAGDQCVHGEGRVSYLSWDYRQVTCELGPPCWAYFAKPGGVWVDRWVAPSLGVPLIWPRLLLRALWNVFRRVLYLLYLLMDALWPLEYGVVGKNAVDEVAADAGALDGGVGGFGRLEVVVGWEAGLADNAHCGQPDCCCQHRG